MLRILIEVLFPFVAPFLVFAAWRLLVTRGRGFLDRVPWFVLTASGLVLVLATLLSMAFVTGDEPDQVYVPPHVRDGQVVPGRFMPRPR
jgi:MFS superfamily sulfate permease-like transporter